jgi:hypothetical protein
MRAHGVAEQAVYRDRCDCDRPPARVSGAICSAKSGGMSGRHGRHFCRKTGCEGSYLSLLVEAHARSSAEVRGAAPGVRSHHDTNVVEPIDREHSCRSEEHAT